MSPEEFRENGYAVVDWLVRYLEDVEKYNVIPGVEPGDIASLMPEQAPDTPEAFAELLADLDRIVMPGITHWQSPNWFAYFPANTSAPSILAEFVTAGLGVQGMLWSTSPAATEIELRVLDWLVDMLDLPQVWKSDGPGGGVIQMSASDATHAMLVVARHHCRSLACAEDMVVYVSKQAHSSIEKGCTIAGIGHCRKIETDSRFAMNVNCLESRLAADVSAGLRPIAVVSAIGTTATTAVDPIRAIDVIAKQYKMWHHVDAAYAGTAMVCPEFRHHQDGVELVDSYTFNPHKWMMVNFDCNVLWVADRAPLIDTMSIFPPYLRNETSDSGAVVDFRDWHVPLGRRFRALKLWWVIRSYGVEGIQGLVRGHVRLAQEFSAWIDADKRFKLFAPHPFSLVCFSLVEGNDATNRLAAALNASGKVAVTPSVIKQQSFIRVSIGQTHTDESHVRRLQELIDKLA
jgi:aromatic-L-amino-acid decarboxylase